MSVFSEGEGRGSTFTVELPMTRAPGQLTERVAERSAAAIAVGGAGAGATGAGSGATGAAAAQAQVQAQAPVPERLPPVPRGLTSPTAGKKQGRGSNGPSEHDTSTHRARTHAHTHAHTATTPSHQPSVAGLHLAPLLTPSTGTFGHGGGGGGGAMRGSIVVSVKEGAEPWVSGSSRVVPATPGASGRPSSLQAIRDRRVASTRSFAAMSPPPAGGSTGALAALAAGSGGTGKGTGAGPLRLLIVDDSDLNRKVTPLCGPPGNAPVCLPPADVQARRPLPAGTPLALLEMRPCPCIGSHPGTPTQMLGRLLATHGHTIDEAVDGAAGVERAKEEHAAGRSYDAILMDFVMPVMDGPTATRGAFLPLWVDDGTCGSPIFPRPGPYRPLHPSPRASPSPAPPTHPPAAIREAGINWPIIGVTGNGLESDIQVGVTCVYG